MRNLSFLMLLLVDIPSIAIAQQGPGTSIAQPVQLLPGLGNHHHPIATKSPEAQKFFDQGLALVWVFNRAEAERSFRRSAGDAGWVQHEFAASWRGEDQTSSLHIEDF